MDRYVSKPFLFVWTFLDTDHWLISVTFVHHRVSECDAFTLSVPFYHFRRDPVSARNRNSKVAGTDNESLMPDRENTFLSRRHRVA